MQSSKSVPADVAAQHYVEGLERGKNAERDRVLRIILSELERSEERRVGKECV